MAKQKHSFKEKWGSFRNFAKGEPLCAFMGDSYIEKTNIMNRREWRGFVDTAYDFGWWLPHEFDLNPFDIQIGSGDTI